MTEKKGRQEVLIDNEVASHRTSPVQDKVANPQDVDIEDHAPVEAAEDVGVEDHAPVEGPPPKANTLASSDSPASARHPIAWLK